MVFNESHFLDGIDRRRREERQRDIRQMQTGLELPPVITKAHEKLRRTVFTNHDFAVQAPEFFPIYGEDTVKKEMMEVLSIKKRFEKNDTPEMKKAALLSETFEGLVLVNAKENNWFGEGTLLKTSSYDDVINKTDMYGEWYVPEKGTRVLALAVDLTFSGKKSADKLEEIKQEIHRGEMGQIRYFRDVPGNIKGTRYNVARIVLGVGSREIADMASLWLLNKKEKLANHPVRSKLIYEMHTQLTHMRLYAEKLGQKKVADAYAEALSVISPLYEKIEPALIDTNDPVLRSIRDKMSAFA